MSVASFENIFSHSVGCLFVLFMVSFVVQNRNRLTDLENELMVTSGEGWGGGIDRECGIDMYILLYFT